MRPIYFPFEIFVHSTKETETSVNRWWTRENTVQPLVSERGVRTVREILNTLLFPSEEISKKKRRSLKRILFSKDGIESLLKDEEQK